MEVLPPIAQKRSIDLNFSLDEFIAKNVKPSKEQKSSREGDGVKIEKDGNVPKKVKMATAAPPVTPVLQKGWKKKLAAKAGSGQPVTPDSGSTPSVDDKILTTPSSISPKLKRSRGDVIRTVYGMLKGFINDPVQQRLAGVKNSGEDHRLLKKCVKLLDKASSSKRKRKGKRFRRRKRQKSDDEAATDKTNVVTPKNRRKKRKPKKFPKEVAPALTTKPKKAAQGPKARSYPRPTTSFLG